MSYSVLKKCLSNPVLFQQLCQTQRGTLGCKFRLIKAHYASSVENNRKSVYEKQVKHYAQRNKLDMVLGALSVDSKTERLKAHDEQKDEMEELQDMAAEERKVTGVPAVIRHAIPSLLPIHRSSFIGRCLCFSQESIAEIDIPVKASQMYNNFCLELGVPYDAATGYCSIRALLKLCDLTERNVNVFTYSKHTAAFEELFERLAHKIYLIDDKSSMKIILFIFTVNFFPSDLSGKVISRFMTLMNEDRYSILELMGFLERLKIIVFKDLPAPIQQQLDRVVRGIWNHISIRPLKISPDLLAALYTKAPENHPGIANLLQNLFEQNIDLLPLSDITVILSAVMRWCRKDVTELELVSKWLLHTCRHFTVPDLELIFSVFIQSDSVSLHLLKFLRKYLNQLDRLEELSSRLISQMLTFCERTRHYDETLLEAACDHWLQDCQGYTAAELACLLKTLSVLHYTPSQHRKFFTKVESYLMEKFYTIDVLSLLEMFVHLVYIERVPVNFSQSVFAPLFLGLVREMPSSDMIKGARYLCVLEEAFLNHGVKPALTLPVERAMLAQGVDNSSNRDILPVLSELLGGYSHIVEKERPTFSSQYLEMKVSDVARAVGFATEMPYEDSDRIALLVMPHSSFTQEGRRMLGFELSNISSLQNRGLTVVTVNRACIEDLQRLKKLTAFLYLLFEQVLSSSYNIQTKKVVTDRIADSDLLQPFSDFQLGSEGPEAEVPDEDMSQDEKEDSDYDVESSVLNTLESEQK